jgi:hypothetical protein
MKRVALALCVVAACKWMPSTDGDGGGASVRGDASVDARPLPLVEVQIESVTSPAEVRMEQSDGGTRTVKNEQRAFALVKTRVRYHRCEDAAPRVHRDGGAPAPAGKFALVTESQAVLTLADGTKAVGDGWTEDPTACVDCNDDPRLLACDAGEPPAQAIYFFFSMKKNASLAGATFQYRDVDLTLPP